MEEKNVKRNWRIVLISVFIILSTLGYFYNLRTGEKTFNKFNSSNIKGKLMWVGDYQNALGFQVIGNFDIFVFHPYRDKTLNDNQFFDDIAKPGDEVVKTSYSDTLFLIKNNKTYKYTFFTGDSN